MTVCMRWFAATILPDVLLMLVHHRLRQKLCDWPLLLLSCCHWHLLLLAMLLGATVSALGIVVLVCAVCARAVAGVCVAE